ncbi:MAG: hypothetical protein PUE16_01010, partial [Lactimicrobium massiliense]
ILIRAERETSFVRYKRLICEGEKPAARIAERAVMWKVHAEDAAFFYAFFHLRLWQPAESCGITGIPVSQSSGGKDADLQC